MTSNALLGSQLDLTPEWLSFNQDADSALLAGDGRKTICDARIELFFPSAQSA
jgi:hypothetical protein